MVMVDKNLEMQFEMFKGTPIALCDELLYYVRDSGIYTLNTRSYSVQQLDLSIFEGFDELIFMHHINRYLFIYFLDGKIEIKVAAVKSINFIYEKTIEISISGWVDTIHVAEPVLLVCGTINEQFNDTKGIIQRIIFEINELGELHALVDNYDGSLINNAAPISIGVKTVVYVEDKTPFDPNIVLATIEGTLINEITSHTCVHYNDTLLCAGSKEENYKLFQIDMNGQIFTYDAPGFINKLMLWKDFIFAVVLVEGEEIVFRIELNTSNAEFSPIITGSGKKEMYPINDGVIVLHFDTLLGVGFYSIDSACNLTIPRTKLGLWEPLNLNSRKIVSSQGAVALILSATSEIKGSILHFHGGPDSYEVEELRFFSSLRELIEEGYQLIILNYQGSKGIGRAHQSAWNNWYTSLQQDIVWLQSEGLLETDCFTAGWSFGGTLAFIATQFIPKSKGVIVGGILSNLINHRIRANEVDSVYGVWFNRRFGEGIDLKNQNNFFFDLNNHLKRPIKVISFHGEEDQHCSYKDFEQFKTNAILAGFAWTHFDLAGKSHYAETLEDATLIKQETLNFVRSL